MVNDQVAYSATIRAPSQLEEGMLLTYDSPETPVLPILNSNLCAE